MTLLFVTGYKLNQLLHIPILTEMSENIGLDKKYESFQETSSIIKCKS